MMRKSPHISSWGLAVCVLILLQSLAAFPISDAPSGAPCPFHHQRRLQQDPTAGQNTTVTPPSNTTATPQDNTTAPADNSTNFILPTQATYDPRKVDWASVVTACRLAGAWEKRFRNFWIRAAFHDGGAINPSDCSPDGTYEACFSQTGLDASLLLNPDEGARAENAYDNFTALTAVMTVRIATVYNTSVADALAVCASVSAEEAGGLSILALKKLKVGRVDNKVAAPRLLPAAVIGTQGFLEWFKSRGYSIEEAAALLGTHSLIDASACYKGNETWCDPYEEACDDVRMFKLENFYYHEVCTPSIVVEPHNNVLDGFVEAPVPLMGDAEFDSLLTSETCKWTSSHMRKFIQTHLDLVRKGRRRDTPETILPLDAHWFSEGCEYSPPGVNKRLACPRFMTAYPYTINDGFLGLACQGNIDDPTNATNLAVQQAMRKMLDAGTWKATFVQAFLKLLNGPAKTAGATVVRRFVTDHYEDIQGSMLTSNIAWMDIDGTECPSGLGADGKCSTAAAKFEDFGIGIALPTADPVLDPIRAAPLDLKPNRLATLVLSGTAVAFIVRRSDTMLPLSIAEIEVYDVTGSKITNCMAISTGGLAPEVLDGDPTTVHTTPDSIYAPSITVRIMTAVQVSRVVVTHGSGQASLVGTIVEYQSSTGTLTDLLATSSLTYSVIIGTNGLQLVDGSSTTIPASPILADNVFTFILASFSGQPISLGPVDVYSGLFQVPLTPGTINVVGSTTDTDPTKPITATPVAVGSVQMSWLMLSMTLPPLTRADRLILQAHSGLEGARLYYGTPGAALSTLVTAAAAAQPTMTVFFGDAVITVPGTSTLISGDTLLEIAIYNPIGDLDLATSALYFFDAVNKAVQIPAASMTVTASMIKIKVDGLGLRRFVIRKIPMNTLIGTVIQLTTTRGVFHQQLTAQVASSTACTVWLSLTGISAVPNQGATPQPEDNTVTLFMSRNDGKALSVTEIAFFDERGMIMDVAGGAVVAGDGGTAAEAVDADLTTTATIDGNPAWLVVKVPSAPTSMVLVGGDAGFGQATISLQDPQEGVGTVELGALDTQATNFTVYVGVNTLTPVAGTSYAFAAGSMSGLFNPSKKPFPAVPPSPYLKDRSVCSVAAEYEVSGYPSSPHVFQPFTVPFKNPPAAVPSGRACRKDGHCLTAYDITVKETTANIGCAKDTVFISYNGTVPGPTLYAPVGEEVLVRYNNRLDGGRFAAENEWPCVDQNNRKGIPLSIHNHGQASLAPHDGWAENRICGGETKDYLYPNNRPATGWCHDHALDFTAPNAYHGAAMFYLMTNKKGQGPNCGEPWNLDNIPEYLLMLSDKLLDSECQLRLDLRKVHINNFYGDVNLVSGLPWPVLTVQPHFVRFRILTAGPTRPYKLHIVDNMGVSVGSGTSVLGSGVRCKVIAGDGGFFQRPVDLPSDGLFVAVAERYEMVCDFRDLAGQTLFLWNALDNVRTKDVPFFCHSHLVMKINVLAGCHAKCTGAALKVMNNEMVCGGMCYRGNCTKGADKQLACCPAGQFCQRQDARYWFCRTGGKAATCPHAGAPEKTTTGEMRCGGKCFQDPTCSGKAEQRACCPDGQFCWARTNNNWVCRPSPPVGTASKDPGLTMRSCSAYAAPVYPTLKSGTTFQTQMDKVLSKADYEAAVAMANDGRAHRVMKFGRRNSEWVINGETWHTFKIAARDVGLNSWEVWELSTGGGWFHPVHIHLVDFWVIRRKGPVDHVEPYEYFAPKDVVALHPSETVWIMARWGPHRGDYMFHCHNLIHEDRAMMRAFRTTTNSSKNMGTASSPVDFSLLQNPSTGVVYDTYNAKDPMSFGATLNPPKLDDAYLQQQVDNSMYRIFFPAADDQDVLLDSSKNPWKVEKYTQAATCPVLVV